MKCFGCQSENWHLFDKDYIGWQERQMGVCKECGTAAFMIDPGEEEKLKEYYRKDYRGQIGPTNLTTTTRKLNYLKNFVGDWLSENEKNGKQLVVGDAGCATGYIVNWFRGRKFVGKDGKMINGHKATGSEWTPIMRRFAEHYYGIPVTEELNDKYKYDLIVMYHTFEHMIEPDKKLERYVNMLQPDGHMVVSVPRWFDILEEPGIGKVSTFKSLYHKDHINVFSDKSLKRLFAKQRLIIEKENQVTYGQTYFLRRAKSDEMVQDVPKEDWKEIVKIMDAQKKAIECYALAQTGQERMFREALNHWKKFPDAYFDWIINSSQKKDRGRCAELIEECMKEMPLNVKAHVIRAYFLYQNENWQAALEDFDYLCKTKLSEDLLMFKAFCLNNLGRGHEAMQAFNDAATLNPEKWAEASIWMCKIATGMKAWDEVATETLKDQLFKKANVQILPEDPIFKENGVMPNGVELKKEEVNIGN